MGTVGDSSKSTSEENSVLRVKLCLKFQSTAILISGLAAFLILNNNQVRDMLESLAEEWTKQPFRLFAGFFDLALFTASIGFYGVFILRRLRPTDIDDKTWVGKLVRGIPHVASAMPGLALAYQVYTMSKIHGGSASSEL